MKTRPYLLLTLCASTILWPASPSPAQDAPTPPAAQPNPDDCDPVTGCPPAISIVDYKGWKAYRLTDGRSVAVVVPAIGRVMRFGLLNGPNWLWNADPETQKNKKPGEWKNWGGDKTWPAPQSEWATLTGKAWPPDTAWDGSPQSAEVLTGAHLRTTSEVSPGTGTRLIREYYFDDATGEFVIAQTVAKLRGAPQILSIWSVTQIEAPDAVFLPLNPNSDYPEKFHWLRRDDQSAEATALSPTLLKVLPAELETGKQKSFKIGVDSPTATIAAVKDGVAFVQRAARSQDTYPDGIAAEDGTNKSGFPVELYDSGQSTAHYMELELLSPLRRYIPGTRWTQTVRWKLHELAGKDVEDAAVVGEIEKLLR